MVNARFLHRINYLGLLAVLNLIDINLSMDVMKLFCIVTELRLLT